MEILTKTSYGYRMQSSKYQTLMAQRKRAAQAGFTLLELSIVLVIVALITAASFNLGTSQLERAKQAATQERLRIIDQALQTFRQLNGRIPCPGDATMLSSNANYGVEAASPSATSICTGGTPAANRLGAVFWDELHDDTPVLDCLAGKPNSVAEGAVPVRSLGLPDELMYDGWGRKITYAISLLAAEQGGMDKIVPTTSCNYYWNFLTIGAVKLPTYCEYYNEHHVDKAAMYLLLSHGSNGHGAYTPAGTRYNAGSTVDEELNNCHCDSSGANTTYHGYYVVPTGTLTSGNYTYDDIILYRNRANLLSANELAWANLTGKYNREFSYSTDTMNGYKWLGNLNTQCESPNDTNFATTISDAPSKITVSGKMNFNPMIVGGRINFVGDLGEYAYPRYAYSTWASSPFNVTSIAFSRDESYLAATSISAPYLFLFQRNSASDFTNAVSITSNLSAPANDVKFSPDGAYLLVASSNFIRLFKNKGSNQFTQQADLTLTGTVNLIAVSSNSVYFAFGTDGGNYLYFYKRSGSNFTSKTISVNPGGAVISASFSSDNRFLLVGSSSSPYLAIYQIDDDGNLTNRNAQDLAERPQNAFFLPFNSNIIYGVTSASKNLFSYRKAQSSSWKTIDMTPYYSNFQGKFTAIGTRD